MDVDHTLWYEAYGSGYIEHYTTTGDFLGEQHYDGLGFASGGEIAAPEPSSIVAAILCALVVVAVKLWNRLHRECFRSGVFRV
jgi:hypothetical protein